MIDATEKLFDHINVICQHRMQPMITGINLGSYLLFHNHFVFSAENRYMPLSILLKVELHAIHAIYNKYNSVKADRELSLTNAIYAE